VENLSRSDYRTHSPLVFPNIRKGHPRVWLVTGYTEVAIQESPGLPIAEFGIYFVQPSVITLKPAMHDQRKTGQRRWPGTELFYPAASC
jgi:hypothetical protein